MTQIGLANLIFKVGFLLCNFKLPFIQGRGEDVDESHGRPCKGIICWGGATDDGLVDVRPNVVLLGTDPELRRWNELKEDPKM